jgi:hypothetical protein
MAAFGYTTIECVLYRMCYMAAFEYTTPLCTIYIQVQTQTQTQTHYIRQHTPAKELFDISDHAVLQREHILY